MNVRKMFEQMDTPYRDEKMVEKENRDEEILDDSVKSEVVHEQNLMR